MSDISISEAELAQSRRRKIARGTQILSVTAALIISGVAVSGASYSAFSVQSQNGGNSWKAGNLQLTNDKTSALFSVDGMAPGSSDSKVITLTSKSTQGGLVRFYSGGAAKDDKGLGKYITLKVTEGTVGSDTKFVADKTGPEGNGVIYSDTLAKLLTDKTEYSNGVGMWKPTGVAAGESKAYKIDYSFSSAAPNDVQGATATATFFWELQ